MKGQWLEAAGFATGCKFDVRVMPGCIVLDGQKLPEPEEPALLQSLRRVCKLSARKKRTAGAGVYRRDFGEACRAE